MLHTIRNSHMSVTVSQQGAELQSILGTDGTEYLWQGDAKYWADRAINIFPYVARLVEGSYYLDGEKHQMSIHGIAPYRRFALTHITETEMVFTLDADTDSWKEYPRDFRFSIGYRLFGDTLEVTFEVENQDEKTMYFGLGGHPGFNVPMDPGKTFSDYRIRFGTTSTPFRVGFSSDCFVNGTSPYQLENGTDIPLSHGLFDEDAIVLGDIPHSVTLDTSGGHGVTVTYPGMQYLGLWHMPKTDAPYVCIEPWCSLPSQEGTIAVFEEQEDLIRLPADEIYRNVWTIQIHTP